MTSSLGGIQHGAQPPRITLGTIADDLEFLSRGLITYAGILAQDYSYRVLRVGIPKNDPASGSFIYRMQGRSVFEGIPVGTGAAGDVGRLHLFGWKPVKPRNAGAFGKEQREALYEKALWVRWPLLDVTFTLGAIVGVAGTDDGWGVDWSTVRFAKTITEVGDWAIDTIGLRTAEPQSAAAAANDIARFRLDVGGAEVLEAVISRADNNPSGGESGEPSGGWSGSETSAPDSVGLLVTRL